MTITLFPRTGSFAENKDVARDIRINQIIPALQNNKSLIIDFSGITGTTQSFIHALISDPIRIFGSGVLDRIHFQNCTPIIRKIITIVADYMQETD